MHLLDQLVVNEIVHYVKLFLKCFSFLDVIMLFSLNLTCSIIFKLSASLKQYFCEMCHQFGARNLL